MKVRFYWYLHYGELIFVYVDYDGSFFESQTFIKGSVGVTRKLAVTKVRPRAMDQKMKRIAEKAKV